jgi:hypothetical protein
LQQGSLGDKAWRLRVGKKLKFSFSEDRLEKCLASLRKLNQDFRTLAAQTARLGDAHQQSPATICVPRSDQKVKECRLIRKASAQLYKALERACQIHEEHSARFRLESQHVIIEGTGFPLVRFNMAFAHRPSRTSATLEPVWIAVDSTFDELDPDSQLEDGNTMHHQPDKTLNDLSKSLKRGISLPCSSPTKKIKTKSVSFAMTSPRAGFSTKTTLVPSFLADPALPDFCEQHDLCNQLQRYGPKTPANKYIGYFEKSGPCKHLVYFAPPITSYSMRQSVSLAQIVSLMSQRSQVDGLLQYERLRLARQLASSVLQFHATPLLKSCWRSDDVVFFGTAASSASLTSPHLNVQVRKSSRPDVKATSHGSNVPSNECQGFIRNPYLFGLGVILIELAHQAPLSSLRTDRDLTNGFESKHTDFFVADRLSKSMGSSLGVSYAKVVRKCLGCDFGEGTTDLNDPGLQTVFYKDVVCELERLENAFATLQLAT